jgi:hypothetical protein
MGMLSWFDTMTKGVLWSQEGREWITRFFGAAVSCRVAHDARVNTAANSKTAHPKVHIKRRSIRITPN